MPTNVDDRRRSMDGRPSCMRRRASLAVVAMAAPLAGLGGGALAADAASATSIAPQLTEIVVTARHRTEDVQKVPVAVSVLGASHFCGVARD